MPVWLKRLTGRDGRARGALSVAETPAAAPTFPAKLAPEFATRLAVESPGAPGRAGAEALYNKWAARWQEF